MQANVIAGYILSRVGDDRAYSHICSPTGNNLSDNALRSALIDKPNHFEYSFLDRGSDERQYCSPNVDFLYADLVGLNMQHILSIIQVKTT